MIYQFVKFAFQISNKKLFSYTSNDYQVFYQKLIDSQFFKYAVFYFTTYQWNNFYQNMFFKMISDIIFNKEKNCYVLLEHVFLDLKLLQLMIQSPQTESFSFDSGYKINNSCVSFYCEIACLIQTNQKVNSNVIQLIKDSN